MKSSRRQSILRSLENGRRRQAFLSGTKRRLVGEQLEGRMLLAGDVLHNLYDPCDTNNDGWLTAADALHVINQLNRDSTAAASGEGEQHTQSYMNDVDADGQVTAHDALMVINQLNKAEGEGTPLVQYTVQALKTDGTLLNGGPIQKGTDYYLQVLIKDLRTGTVDPDKPNGLFSAWLDVLYNKSLASVEIEEIQTITFTDAPTGGTFTLSFNGNTTGNITYNSSNAQTTAANIQTALQGLASIGSGNVDVQPVSLADPTVYTVRFQGARGDQDVSMLTANPANLTPSGQHINIAETVKGIYSPASFLAAFRFGTALPTQQLAQDGQPAAPANDPPLTADPNRINDAGAIGGFDPYLQPTQNKELFRVRMNTLDAGTLSLVGNVTDVISPSRDTYLRGRDDRVTPDLITIVNHSLAVAPEVVTITEPFSAIADTFAFTETATPAPISLTNTAVGGKNVKANDTPQPLTGLSITKINGGTAAVNLSIGTVTLASGAISFTPLANVNGSAAFTYTLANASGITDTATVTLNVSAVNNAPVNTVPGAQLTSEEAAKAINGILIADIDVNETANATMQVDLTVQHGIISLQNVPGTVVFLGSTNNNESSISLQGSLADLNTAINGLIYTPAQDYNGPDTFRIITNDQNNTGSGGAKSDNDTVAITVTAVNDAPTVSATNSTQNPTETFDLTFNAANFNQFSVADVDVGEAGSTVVGADKNKMRVTLTVAGSGANTPGTLTLGSTANISIVAGANNSSSMSIQGTLADVNNAINNLVLHTVVGSAGGQTLTVTANDLGNSGAGGVLTNSKVVNINVIPLTRPYAFPDPATVEESSANNPIDVLLNDMIDDDATGKVLVTVGSPGHGSITSAPGVNPLTYSPTPDFWGSDTFTYVMNETGHPGSQDSTGTVTVTINNIPDNPVAVGDNDIHVDEDTSTDIAVLQNDSDLDDFNNAGFVSTLTPVIVAGPSHGTASVLANGKIRYTAGAGGNQNYNGPDSFTYKIHDETNRESGTVTVNITVDPVNDPPVAVADSYTTTGNRPIEDTLFSTTSLTGVRANDSDVEDSQSSLVVNTVPVSGPTHALTFSLNADGSFSYQATQDYNGPDSFVYQLTDTQGGTATATVTINVQAENDAPVAVPDAYLVEEDTLLNANSPTPGNVRATVRVNDTDVDNANSTLLVSLESGPSHALPGAAGFTLNSDGSFTYQAELNYQGPDSFVYRLSDGALSSTATVSITVTEKNDPPVAVDDSYVAVEDEQIDVLTAAGVRDGAGLDDDPDSNNPNSTLKVVLVSGPTHAATFSLNGNDLDTTDDGAFSYKAAANYNGQDSFTYKLVDLFGVSSNTATVTITIAERNDDPTARDDGSPANPLTLIKNTVDNPFENQEIDVLDNDDAAPDYLVPPPSASFNNIDENLTITAIGTGVNGPQHGTVTISGDGKKLFYTPDVGYESAIDGPEQFTYTISDNRTDAVGRTGTATKTVYIEVVNFVPTEVTGKVFVDTNNNGVQDPAELIDLNGNGKLDPAERPMAGVKITLQGHDSIFNIDFGTDTDNNSANDVAALVVYTDVNGNYRFDAPGSQRPGMRPGTYTITEEQPAFMRDGKDTAGNTAAVLANDMMNMVLPLLGVPGGILGNNFAERGLDTTAVSTDDIMASSNSAGLMFAMNGSNQLWSTKLGLNWTNLDFVTVVYNNPNSVTFTFYDKAGSPGQVRTLSQMGSASYYNNARFHILSNAGGNTLLQLDASAADLGLDLLAAGNNNQQAEGEADGDAGYTRSVDELMTAVGNA